MDHDYKVVDAFQRAAFKTIHRRIAQHIPHADAIVVSKQYRFVDGSFADASYRVIDDALEGLLIARVGNDAQVSHKIFYFFALVKTHASINAVGNAHASQRFFIAPALCIGAVENGKVAVEKMIAEFELLDGIRHIFALIIIRHGAHQFHLFSFAIVCKQSLFYLVFVVADNFVGNI